MKIQVILTDLPMAEGQMWPLTLQIQQHATNTNHQSMRRCKLVLSEAQGVHQKLLITVCSKCFSIFNSFS